MSEPELVDPPIVIPQDILDAAVAKHIEVRKETALLEYNIAMSDCQAAIPAILKTSGNEQTRSRYAKLNEVLSVANPILTDFGFSVSFGEADCPKENWIRVEARVGHRAGHVQWFHNDVPNDTMGIKGNVNKTEMHGNASAKQYAQRYLMSQIFNLRLADSLDTDGNAPIQYITLNQQADIEALIQEKGADLAKILRICRADSIDMITADRYTGIIARIQAHGNTP